MAATTVQPVTSSQATIVTVVAKAGIATREPTGARTAPQANPQPGTPIRVAKPALAENTVLTLTATRSTARIVHVASIKTTLTRAAVSTVQREGTTQALAGPATAQHVLQDSTPTRIINLVVRAVQGVSTTSGQVRGIVIHALGEDTRTVTDKEVTAKHASREGTILITDAPVRVIATAALTISTHMLVGAVATIVVGGMCPTATGGGEATEMDAGLAMVTNTPLGVIATIVLEDSHQTGVAVMLSHVVVSNIGTQISHTSGGVQAMPIWANLVGDGIVGDMVGTVIIIIAGTTNLARRPLMASPTLRSGGEILAYILAGLIVSATGGRSTLEGASG